MPINERTEYFLKFALIATIAFVLSAATFSILMHLVGSQILGPDEAVYLTKARSWLSGTPADQWGIYRPVGLPIIGWAMLHFGDSERFFRFAGVAGGTITIVLIFLLFRKVCNLWIAINVTLVVMASTLFLSQAPLFLDDISSSGSLFLLLLVIYTYYRSSGRSNAIYLAGPAAASAFYLRYGATTALMMIAVASAIILFPKFIKKPESDWRKLSISLGIAVALFLPHFIYSLMATKSVIGVLANAGGTAYRAYLGDGLVQYIRWLPNQIGGWVMDISAIVGVAVFIVIASARKLRDEFVGLLWLGAIGFGSFFLTGLLVHAEQRYIFFSMVLLSGVGIAGVYYLLERWSTFSANVFITALAAIVIFLGLQNYSATDASFRGKETYPFSLTYIQKLTAIRSENPNGCVIWTRLNGPQASWYSACNVFKPLTVSEFSRIAKINFGKPFYSFVGTKFKIEQISPESANKYNVLLTSVSETPNISPLFGSLLVYRIFQSQGVSSGVSTSTVIQLIQH